MDRSARLSPDPDHDLSRRIGLQIWFQIKTNQTLGSRNRTVERVSGRANWRNERNEARPVKVLWTGESSSGTARPVHQDRHGPPAAQACRLRWRGSRASEAS